MSGLWLLSGGAAQGLASAVAPGFEKARGVALEARFGAVGAMREALLAGEPCDVFVTTQRMADELVAQGRLRAASVRPLGRVRTGVAVRADDALPTIDTPQALRAALLASSGVYFPDPERATAGIHFANVMRTLGVAEALQGRLHAHPNGATAMRALAAAPRGAIGCTQVSEILFAGGVALVGALPPQFELATVYSAAVVATPSDERLAEAFVDALAGAASEAARRTAGFEPA